MILQYYMIRGEGTIPRNSFPPVRENPSDAGLDLRWTPTELSERLFKIDPGQSVLIPTGCKFAIPHGYMLEIKNKSGIAHKRQLLVGGCVVDSGYEGEVFVNLHNTGTETQYLDSDTPDIYEWCPITISERGTGALGSTGQ